MMPRKPAPKVVADILVEAGNWPKEEKLGPLVDRAIAGALAGAKPELAANCELSVLFTDDAHIRRLNRKFRQKDLATNVLSFPAAATGKQVFGPLLGDIVLAF